MVAPKPRPVPRPADSVRKVAPKTSPRKHKDVPGKRTKTEKSEFVLPEHLTQRLWSDPKLQEIRKSLGKDTK